jgi:sigma-E factor negative regulatory protein RseB
MSASTRFGVRRAIAIVLAAFLTATLAVAADDPRAWLERMGQAVERLNYEGTLVHVIGNDMKRLRVVHRVDKGEVTEKIASDDPGREIIRNGDEVTCIFPDQRMVLVEERNELDRSHSPLRSRLPGVGGIRDAFYHLSFAGTERIAGRKTQVIAIRPKDSFRYGYRIWLDRATAMPLKTQLVDEESRMLEQILFSDIGLPERIPDSDVRPSMPIDSFAVRRAAVSLTTIPAEPGADWSATQLPAGFALTVRQARTAPDAERGLRHLVYSDGLATVSLFIEPAVAASEQAEGLSQIGSANAYTTVHDGHMVTAVGEVPARTVELLAQSARPVTPTRRSDQDPSR